ncbi:signal recognition particle-docking protein FtsY [Desulfobulbus sp.]|uniref:signal recognition particle-docking protein FtsY n=1 Tax=Desulfobulbus sp. TaxID=895 RepID=UPI0027B8BEB7|nr:signal recognition particle-docking protein FtsY [Desulfobulbus sp.]
MLGWFKKKFGKKPAEPEVVAPEPIPDAVEEVLIEAPLADQAPATQEPLAVAELQAPIDAEEETTEAAEAAVAEAVAVESAEPIAVVAEPVLDDAITADAMETAESAEVVEPAAAAVEPVAVDPIAAEAIAPDIERGEDHTPDEQTAAIPGPPAVEPPDAQGVDDTAAPVALQAEPAPLIEGEATAGDEPEPASALETEETAPQEPTADEGAELAAEEAVNTDAEPSASPIVPAAPLVSKTQEKPSSKSLFKRLQERLGKTRDSFVYRLDRLFLGKKEIDQDLFEQLEEILITADLGVATTLELLDGARKKVKRDQLSDPQALKTIIRDQIATYIQASEQPAELVMPEDGPFVIMVVGVNGVGKTTSIGKIAAKFVRAGQSVLMVAGDTFRAAAINQLRIWGERVGVEVIAQNPGSDPSSVVYDGLEYGVAHNFDVILIDTAGRLHTSVNLMEELKKIKRVIGKKMPGAPHEVMLVLDATTGQNGISQAKMFHEAVGVSGLTLTKLDGTAKGGIVANVCRETKIPVRFIGIGEQIDDLRDFDAREFVDALFAGQER